MMLQLWFLPFFFVLILLVNNGILSSCFKQGNNNQSMNCYLSFLVLTTTQSVLQYNWHSSINTNISTALHSVYKLPAQEQLGFSVLPKDTSVCRLDKLGIEPHRSTTWATAAHSDEPLKEQEERACYRKKSTWPLFTLCINFLYINAPHVTTVSFTGARKSIKFACKFLSYFKHLFH